MESEGVLYVLFSAVWLMGPKYPSSVTGHPAVRWCYAKLLKAAVALRDTEWLPRMGAYWAGIRRSCAHATSDRLPLRLTEVRAVLIRGECALSRSRKVAARQDLPAVGRGLGS